ncbi:uncharacterized protein LOC132269144 isoform X2 [Cornus florida]|uniref:uncharacterized protein LOC132269144 isoform X2 n=1 Tax=Cornus florida TaxID=4283 RepID=UPI002897A41F|nr:uncharacterized protein LOC132269144 isoform X2 [Cornus florida]XP_059626193.1 uncharacterized protein LOC132269144 isoform X2 [Cornus florida]XP_059626194.1 uncharacterized protein LOC132269144 isoform X2 [Cornus florida]XP_059626195.1 uncharacterized protein LOC132269144 isoform X2 [Cornus florida]XP_059626196.1 uncharacterized protein LOC132269144 isoform X2 [Cornus florida]
MEDAARSLFMVASFHESLHCAAIYEIKFGGGGGGVGEIKIDGPLVKAFSCSEENRLSLVDCDMVGSKICLAASCTLSTEDGRKIISFDPLLFDTVTKELDQLPKPQAKKPYPKVMAVGGSFYVLSTDTLCSGFRIKSPSFERFDPIHRKWDSIVPEYRVPAKTSMAVVGYAVINDIILISVENATNYGKTEFHCYRIGSSMEKWQVVEKEYRDVRYYAFIGKSEFVDDFVYTWVENCLLIAYHVTFSSGDDDDRTIKSLGAPVKIVDTDPLDDLLYRLYTSSLVHLGNKVFCVARTEIKRVPPKVQHVTIMTLKVSDSMDPVTVSAEVSTDFYLLNTEGLGQADVQSLFLDSRWMQYDSKSKVAESVDGFLQRLGLQKYSISFEDKKIDMATLKNMTNEGLKALGLRKGPRMMILSAFKSEGLTLGS